MLDLAAGSAVSGPSPSMQPRRARHGLRYSALSGRRVDLKDARSRVLETFAETSSASSLTREAVPVYC